jgi:hypothetical protein
MSSVASRFTIERPVSSESRTLLARALTRSTVIALSVLVCTPALAQRRFALIVGENRGGVGDETLRFAEEDATRVRDVLVELGQVEPADATLVLGASAPSLRRALEQMRTALRLGQQPGNRLMVYVSSHAGEGALHLDGTELPLGELVDFVKQAPVDVGVLIIDACRAGSMTRTKGLRQVDVPPVVVEATGLQGRVLISASGADEYAQESDALQGSAFTHFWVLGLRGAADESGDGRVTLDEAYAWAWSRTLESTFGSAAGIQHPNVKIDLHGQGQLVLSEPGRHHSRLTLGVEAPGHWLVANAASHAVVADVSKPEGALTLALPSGAYIVRLRTETGVLRREVQVPVDGVVVVRDAELERASSLRAVAVKGGAAAQLAVSVSGAVASGLVSGLSAQPGVELRFRRDAPVFKALNQLSLAASWRTGSGALTNYRADELQLGVGSGHRFVFSALSLFVGLELGALLVLQSRLPELPDRASLGPLAGLEVEARIPLSGAFELTVVGAAGGVLLRTATGVSVLPRTSLAGGLLLAW